MMRKRGFALDLDFGILFPSVGPYQISPRLIFTYIIPIPIPIDNIYIGNMFIDNVYKHR
jgi:hypothetical protein